MEVPTKKSLSRLQGLILFLRSREYEIYTWLSVGIVYSLVFWPLLNSMCIIGLFVFWCLVSRKTLAFNQPQKLLLIVFLSLYLIGLIGMFYTENRNEGIFRLQQKLPLLLFPLMYGTTNVPDGKMRGKICLHFIIATTLACFISLIVKLPVLFMANGVEAVRSKLFLFRDSYPYMIGLFCLLSIIFAFTLMKNVGFKLRILLTFVILFLSIFLLLLSVRVVIASWAIVLVIKAYSIISNTILRVGIAIVIVASVISGIIFIPKLSTQWKELTELRNNTITLDADSSQGKSWGGGAIRIAIWQSSKELVQRSWLTGVGTGDIQDSLQQAYRSHQFYFASEYNKYNAHNQYLQSLIGNGLPGFISLLLCILMPIIFIKTFDVGIDYLLFLLLFALLGVTESILEINKGIVWYSFFNSIFAFSKSNIINHNTITYDRKQSQEK